jgi:N-carbamoyl-L-amino-acid hydrolase
VAAFGVDLDRALDAHAQLRNAKAYLELHIEQGPVLLDRGEALGVVIGTFGVERHSIRFTGQAAHSGSTPMDKRRDALGAAAKFHLAIREIAVRHGGVCTCGSVKTLPGIVTSVVAQCDITLDQRHMDADHLAAMLQEAKDASEKFAAEEKCQVEWSRLWQIHPIPFHPTLLDFCEEAVREVTGTAHRLPSGPLHDAAEVARAGVPTVMMFTQSLHGISHNKIEDTKEEHIAMSVEALNKLAHRAMEWVAAQ